MSDKDLRVEKNDPHNPARLLNRKRDPNGNGTEQVSEGWTPTAWNDTGAGKGDRARRSRISSEEYGLKYDLATGRITREEFDKAMKALTL